MTHPYLAQKLAVEHERELRLSNCRRSLMLLARCCRPSAWRRAWRRLHPAG